MGNDALPCSKHTKKDVEKPRLVDHVFGESCGFATGTAEKNGWSAADFEAGTTMGKSTAVEYTIYWYT